MNDFYIFVNSSNRGIYRNNSIIDFTFTLPRMIDLTNGSWEVGLCDYHFFSSNTSLCKLYICCDIIKSSFTPIGNLSTLRYIPSLKNKHKSTEFNHIYYFDIINKYIDKIRVYIRGEISPSDSFKDDSFYCTLHLRKKKEQS